MKHANAEAEVLNRLVTNYIAFHTLDTGQAGTSPEGLQYDIDQTNLFADKLLKLRARIRKHKRNEKGPKTPLDQNGRRRVPAFWCAKPELEILKARITNPGLAADVAAGRVGLLNDVGAGTWTPWWKLESGMAEGYLWLKFDDQHNVIDRVFRKDMFLTEGEWIRPWRWEGDLRDPDAKLPFELTCHRDLQNLGTPYLARMREGVQNDFLDNEKCTYRLYVEWCSHGDLGRLINIARAANKVVPEPFIWNVTKALALGGYSMQHGKLYDGSATVADEWNQIIRR